MDYPYWKFIGISYAFFGTIINTFNIAMNQTFAEISPDPVYEDILTYAIVQLVISITIFLITSLNPPIIFYQNYVILVSVTKMFMAGYLIVKIINAAIYHSYTIFIMVSSMVDVGVFIAYNAQVFKDE